MLSCRVHVGALLLACSLALPSSARAWCNKEHIQFARLAAERLLDDPRTPEPMKLWLRQAAGPDLPSLAAEEDFFLHRHIGPRPEGFTGVLHWAYMPDMHAQDDPRDSVVPPFGVHERILHYIDLELLLAPEARRGYRHDLSGKPSLDQVAREMNDPRYAQAGMLPFRVQQCYGQLVDSIRQGRLHAPTLAEQDGRTATFWAGYLSHYVADSTQPQHATVDYKSQGYFADRRNAPNIHAALEYGMCDDEPDEHPDLRKEFWPLFAKELTEFTIPVQTKDPWQSTLETCLHSYDALPLIGLAAMTAAGQGGTPEHPAGPAGLLDLETFFRHRGQYMGREMSVMEMKAIQTAWAVKRIEAIWRQAWEEGMAKGQR